jgi:hypothetical protein
MSDGFSLSHATCVALSSHFLSVSVHCYIYIRVLCQGEVLRSIPESHLVLTIPEYIYHRSMG